jgi:hypothetical protein
MRCYVREIVYPEWRWAGEMADHMSGGGQRQVAISMCSTPVSDWSHAGAATPRLSAEKVMRKSKNQDGKEHTPEPEVPLIKKVIKHWEA